MKKEAKVPIQQDAVSRLRKLLEATNKDRPNQADVNALSELLREHPELITYATDVLDASAKLIIDRMPVVAAIKEPLRVQYEQLQQDLRLPSDTVFDDLQIQQVAVSWLELAYVRYQYSSSLTELPIAAERVAFWDKRLSSAQARFLKASESLAHIRKMNLTVVQVNIGQQQVNRVG